VRLPAVLPPDTARVRASPYVPEVDDRYTGACAVLATETVIVTVPPETYFPVSVGVNVADTVVDPPPVIVRVVAEIETTDGSADEYTKVPATLAVGATTGKGSSPNVLLRLDQLKVGVAFAISKTWSSGDAARK
jgi:hypothetical protein